MNLSILIPTFNYVCIDLVRALAAQCEQCPQLDDYEIIVADDGSEDKFIGLNRGINLIPHCHYEETAENIGRSRILNKMTTLIRYEWTLIIDSDAEVLSDDFINKYLSHTEGNDVICGGITTSRKHKRKDNLLRYKYEKSAQSIRSLTYRNANPYQHFSSFNILINTKVFNTVNFDDSIKQYGYEDTLFGIGLKRNKYKIVHIDNPLIHSGIDTNLSYLTKTEQALQNLVLLKDKLQEGSVLYQTYLKCRKIHLLPLIKIWHKLFSSVERRNLLSRHPSLFVFELYKLGYFTEHNK